MHRTAFHRWLLLVALCLLSVAAARAAEIPVAAWRIETKQGADGIPVSKLDLVIRGRHVTPIRSAQERGDYRVIPRQDFAYYKVPADALCACQSHVVNDGVYYYVVALDKDMFALYRQLEDVEGLTGYKQVRTITIRTRTSVRVVPHDSSSGLY